MKTASAIILTAMTMFSISSRAQTIIGTWQLVRESNCPETQLDEGDSELLAEMKSMSSSTPQIVRFREKGTGEESTRILGKRKKADRQNFLYKFDSETLYILDKRSQTITETFMVDKISSDSLILSDTGRPCEMKIFVKIREQK